MFVCVLAYGWAWVPGRDFGEILPTRFKLGVYKSYKKTGEKNRVVLIVAESSDTSTGLHDYKIKSVGMRTCFMFCLLSKWLNNRSFFPHT